jgi:TonB family protein
MNGHLPLADSESSGVRIDPEHPLKLGQEFYPAGSRKTHEEGKCIVRVTVMPDGHIRNASIQASSGYTRLDQACLNAVRDGRMLPAVEGGKPVETTIGVPILWKSPN